MVYYLRPRTSSSSSLSSHSVRKSSPYRFYRASPNSSESKSDAASPAQPALASPVPPAAVVDASPQLQATPVAPGNSSNDMLQVAVPYLIITVVVSAVVATVIMATLKPCKGCLEFLTKKDEKGEVVAVDNLKVIGFSLGIGLAVGLLCFGVHSVSPSVFDP